MKTEKLSELQHIRQTYFQNINEICYHGNLPLSFLNNILTNAKDYSGRNPDIVSELEHVIVAIEHFEFDASASNKKGSMQGQELGQIEHAFEKKINRNLEQEGYVRSSHITNTPTTLVNYYDNFKKHFSNHYKKVDQYIQNIRHDFETEKDICMCFFAEDTTLFGSMFQDVNGNPRLAHPLFSKDNITTLTNSPKVKYLIIAIQDQRKIHIIENKKDVLQQFSEKAPIITEERWHSNTGALISQHSLLIQECILKRAFKKLFRFFNLLLNRRNN